MDIFFNANFLRISGAEDSPPGQLKEVIDAGLQKLAAIKEKREAKKHPPSKPATNDPQK